MQIQSAATEIEKVLQELNSALVNESIDECVNLFSDDCYWRDFVSFTWNILTLEGKMQIRDMLQSRLNAVSPQGFEVDRPELAQRDGDVTQAFIKFTTAHSEGYGYVRLKDGRIWTLLTTMQSLKGHEEHGQQARPWGLVEGRQVGEPTWAERREQEIAEVGVTTQPYVLIVGGGHSGIILAARLRQLDVPTLVVEKNDRPGDNWRNRYNTLQLHNPIWENHLPYIPFPDSWPVYMSKDKFADWLEMYTKVMEINFWGGSEVRAAQYDDESKTWSVSVEQRGKIRTLHPSHLVMSTGEYARPKVPNLPGQEHFTGVQEHSSEHPGPEGLEHKKVVVVGSGTSAHDICAALATHGSDVTMIQRSPTYVVKPRSFNEHVLGPLYSEEAVERGINAEMADILGMSIPYALFFDFQKSSVEKINEVDADFYKKLAKTGYLLDDGPQGAGLFARALTGVNNYYVDVGAIQMIMDGEIKVVSGVGVSELTENHVVLGDGRSIAADVIIYATGFESMYGTVAELISGEVADNVGEVGGVGSGEGKDPGPWEGELRNMWKPVSREALWFHGGLIARARSNSRYLALQLKARMEGLRTPVYSLSGMNQANAS